jgi:hypothetical protein
MIMGSRLDESVWDERREWLDKQRSSGMSVAGFCREHGLSVAGFNFWRKKFNGAAVGDVRSRNKSARRSAAFIQVPLPAEALGTAKATWVEISLADGMIVRVPASNLSALKTVLSTLSVAGESDHA